MNSTVPLGADIITIQLYNPSNLINPVYSDTRVIDINGNGIFYFPPSASIGNYYVVVKHRNSLETWSKNAIAFSSNTFYDFTQ